MENRDAMRVERLLTASGFQMRFADTSEKLAHLETLPQRKLVAKRQSGEVRYVYADAQHCRCLYAGTEQAYRRYQNLAVKQQIADEYRSAAIMNEDAAMDWGMWRPWGPWY